MRIKIKLKGKLPLFLPVPNFLVLNHFASDRLPALLKENGITATPEQTKAWVRLAKECRKRLGSWTLVEVHTADGEDIIIKM